MARARGARAQMALAFESVYGTPPSAGAFWKMPFASSGLGSEQPLLESELLGFGRDPLPPLQDAISADGDIVVPIDARYLGIWLKALFGEPTTTGASAPYSHEFQSANWAIPSFAVETGMPEVPHYAMCPGCKANSINWTMQRSGLVTATVNVIAQGEDTAGSSVAGTLEQMALQRFSSFNGSIKRGGSQLANVVSGQITYGNNLERVETIREDGKIDGLEEAMAMLSGEITVRFADHTLLDAAVNGTPAEFAFGYQIDADTTFTLTAHAVYLPKPKQTIEGPGGVEATFAWQAAQTAGGGRMATATLVNDVANYDNPNNA
ncbi:phage tail tube protein [Tranquillimonas rosea]|uniref:phage tail tube protein n=1 Tax=Tranquillimonas rosea TaxID=641238 RepID=UPI003BAAA652